MSGEIDSDSEDTVSEDSALEDGVPEDGVPEDSDSGLSDSGESGDDAHAYFRAIEELFIDLRGSPMLLSPSDWQTARDWHERGIPQELIRGVLEDVFERRRLRGAGGKIQSLKYCANAVESAWQEVKALSHPRRRQRDEPLDCDERLRRLARSLPPDLERRASWSERIRALVEYEEQAGAQEVEQRLADLDEELVQTLLVSLGDEGKQLELEARDALRSLERSGGGNLELATRRLLRQRVRRRFGVPVLSLFSHQATGRAE